MSSPDAIRRFTPCLLTLSRLFLLPVLLWHFQRGHFQFAICLYLLAIFTDIADGYLARHWHTVTYAGILLDPIVDKLFLCSAIGFFTWHKQLPLFFLALTGFRFLGQIFLFMWVRWRKKCHYPYRPHFLPKLSAFTCYALILLLLIRDLYPEVLWMDTLKLGLLWSCTGLESVILLIFVPDVLRFLWQLPK